MNINYDKLHDHDIANALTEIVGQLRKRDLLSQSFTRSARSLSGYVRNIVNARTADSVTMKDVDRELSADAKAAILNGLNKAN
jgi:hypothetical protein